MRGSRPGRPKKETILENRITIRLDDESYEMIFAYAKAKNVSPSELIRDSVMRRICEK